MRIIPSDKFDIEACKNLAAASDVEVTPYISELLECLQDLNWPISAPVSDRLSVLGTELVIPLKEILKSTDEIWKYWIISNFLYKVDRKVVAGLMEELKHIESHPTEPEIKEEVYEEVCRLLKERTNA